MRLISYEYHDPIQPSWNFNKIELEKINLFVGESGSGKTRILNTIMNFGRFVVINEFKGGKWKISFEQNEKVYVWEVESIETPEGDQSVTKEILSVEVDNQVEEVIVDRTEENFSFSGKDLPILSRNSLSVFLLREEPIIKPIHQGFTLILRRSFFLDELQFNIRYEPISLVLADKIKDKLDFTEIFKLNLNLNTRLYLLKRNFPDLFREIEEFYKSIFPFVRKFDVKELGEFTPKKMHAGFVPVFAIKENYVESWLTVQDLSSGMQKVLLLITDILTAPDSTVYLVDEYENSLGVNAVNFLPTFLQDYGGKNQFILTSHHPYLINNIPVKDWFIFHRKGSNVIIKYGKEIEEKFGKSKQKAFVQLINDPFYIEGIE